MQRIDALVLVMVLTGVVAAGCLGGTPADGRAPEGSQSATFAIACDGPCGVTFGGSELTRMHFVRAVVDPNEPARVAVRLTRQVCPQDRPYEQMPTCPQETGWPAEVTEIWVTADHGATWAQGTLPAGFAADHFGLGFAGDGTLILALDAGPAAIQVATSRDGGLSFGAPSFVPLVDPLELASLASDGSCSGGNVPGVEAGADGLMLQPSPAVTSSPESGEAVITAYQCLGTKSIRFSVLHTRDGGASWTRKPTLVVGPSVGYLSLRLTLSATEWTAITADAPEAFAETSAIVLRRSIDKGETWTPQVLPLEHAAAAFWPELASDGSPAAALTYFEFTEETSAGYGGALQYLATTADGGATWTKLVVDEDRGVPLLSGVAYVDGVAWTLANEYVEEDSAFVTFLVAMDGQGRMARHELALVAPVDPRQVGPASVHTPSEMAYLVPQPDGVLVVWAESEGRQVSTPSAARFRVA